jgi:hypothetical protein
MGEVNRNIQEIAGAVQEQSAATSEISHGVRQAAHGTEDVVAHMPGAVETRVPILLTETASSSAVAARVCTFAEASTEAEATTPTRSLVSLASVDRVRTVSCVCRALSAEDAGDRATELVNQFLGPLLGGMPALDLANVTFKRRAIGIFRSMRTHEAPLAARPPGSESRARSCSPKALSLWLKLPLG